MDLRDRVVAACDMGAWTREEIAEKFDVSTSWIRRLLQRRRELGSYAPLQGRHVGGVTGAHRRLVQRGDGVQHASASGVSSKKKTLRAAEQDRPDVARQRRAWARKVRDVDRRRFRFIDEIGAKTNMTRLRGRCKGGGRLVDATPHGHWETTTMIGSLGAGGSTAPMAIEGAANALAGIHELTEIQKSGIVVGGSSHRLASLAGFLGVYKQFTARGSSQTYT